SGGCVPCGEGRQVGEAPEWLEGQPGGVELHGGGLVVAEGLVDAGNEGAYARRFVRSLEALHFGRGGAEWGDGLIHLSTAEEGAGRGGLRVGADGGRLQRRGKGVE